MFLQIIKAVTIQTFDTFSGLTPSYMLMERIKVCVARQ
jgi:hypothetical protein